MGHTISKRQKPTDSCKGDVRNSPNPHPASIRPCILYRSRCVFPADIGHSFDPPAWRRSDLITFGFCAAMPGRASLRPFSFRSFSLRHWLFSPLALCALGSFRPCLFSPLAFSPLALFASAKLTRGPLRPGRLGGSGGWPAPIGLFVKYADKNKGEI